MERLLQSWDEWPVFVQPCLRDVWGAHVLFTGDDVKRLTDILASHEPDTAETDGAS